MAADDTSARLQTLAERQAKKARIRGVVLGLQSGDGRISSFAAAGHADADGSVAMTADTPYLLASISKMYTATVVMTLARRGVVRLDDLVKSILSPELMQTIHVLDGVDYSERITVRHLVNQTSGLPDYFSGKPKGGKSLLHALERGEDRQLSIEEIVAITRTLRPEFPPGKREGKAHYSDTNYALLGAVISAATGKTIAENLSEIILEPLGLTKTFAFDHLAGQPTPAAAFLKDRPMEIRRFLTGHTCEGGLVSTVGESLIFLRAFFDGTLLDEEELALMMRQFNPIFFPLRYGYGIMMFRMPALMRLIGGPPVLVGHSGSTGSFAFWDRKRDLFMAGTLNQMDKPSRPFRVMAQMARLG